jgi:hypothetical protein
MEEGDALLQGLQCTTMWAVMHNRYISMYALSDVMYVYLIPDAGRGRLMSGQFNECYIQRSAGACPSSQNTIIDACIRRIRSPFQVVVGASVGLAGQLVVRVPLEVAALQLHASCRVMLAPLLEAFPLVGSVEFSLLKAPHLDLEVRVGGGMDLMAVPLLRDACQAAAQVGAGVNAPSAEGSCHVAALLSHHAESRGCLQVALCVDDLKALTFSHPFGMWRGSYTDIAAPISAPIGRPPWSPKGM